MAVLIHRAASFGAHDRLRCNQCSSGSMHVMRRSPHPNLGAKYELQMLVCDACEFERLRSVDSEGVEVGPPPKPADQIKRERP